MMFIHTLTCFIHSLSFLLRSKFQKSGGQKETCLHDLTFNTGRRKSIDLSHLKMLILLVVFFFFFFIRMLCIV